MADSGADFVEVQIPFSDPLADGPVIAEANQKALKAGTTPVQCLRSIERLARKIQIPILVMTYANIPFKMGIEKFIRVSRESGVSGFIFPDMPLDICPQCLEFTEQYGGYCIPVVSPGMKPERLQQVIPFARGFIYTTLRVGITGARQSIDEKGLDFLGKLKSMTNLPVAAGFGISSAEMVGQLKGRVDVAVIGSHILKLFNEGGIQAVSGFIRECK